MHGSLVQENLLQTEYNWLLQQVLRDYYKYSFSPLAIVRWNALPEDVVSSPSLNIFKAAVGKLQHSKP